MRFFKLLFLGQLLERLDSKDTKLTFKTFLPFIVYLLIVFFSNWTLISNNHFIEATLNKIENRLSEEADQEAVIETIEMTKEVLNNPGYRIIVSLTTTWINLRSLILYLLVSFAVISLISGEWRNFRAYLLVSSMVINLLTIGCIIDLFLKLTLLDAGANLSLAFLVTNCNVSLLDSLSNQVELFSLWFLLSLSTEISIIYRESFLTVLFTMIMIWFLCQVGGILLNFQFKFIL